ncbi:hypothetical protein [Rhodoferax ferrireducens]|nr:hypothetical protein [Rhodoferax ferrireducens]
MTIFLHLTETQKDPIRTMSVQAHAEFNIEKNQVLWKVDWRDANGPQP